jgi:hypothetical protein
VTAVIILPRFELTSFIAAWYWHRANLIPMSADYYAKT